MKNNYFLVLLASVLLLFSCRTELDSSKNHEDNLQRSSNKISLSQFKNETCVKNFKTSIKASTSFKNKAGKTEILLSVFQVDTENINKLDFKENTTYSFRAYNIFESPDQVYNVIYYRKNNQWQYSILKLIKRTDTSFDMIPVYDSRYGSISPVENAHTGRTCLVSYDTTEYHCTCPPSWAECDQCSQCISTHSGTIAYDCGNGSGSGTSEGNPGGNTDSGGGGGSPGGYDPSGYTFDPNIPPTYDVAYIRAKRADAFFRQLDFYGAEVWPSQHPEIYCAILEYYLDQLPPLSAQQNTNALNFANWSVNFFVNNPNTTWEQFQNWFMGTSEGKDGEDYDTAYWDDPNLTFPAQNLPSWQNYYNAFPKDSNGNGLSGPTIYNLIGGIPKAMRDGVLNDSNPSNDHDYDNACALRVSRALNYSGVIIPNLPNQTFKGADGKYYFLSAKKLNTWMRKTFGTNPATSTTPYNPKHINITGAQAGANGINLPNLLGGKKGIYSLVSSNSSWASGHGDILQPNGTCINGCHFFDAPIAYIDVWILQ